MINDDFFLIHLNLFWFKLLFHLNSLYNFTFYTFNEIIWIGYIFLFDERAKRQKLLKMSFNNLSFRVLTFFIVILIIIIGRIFNL